MGLLDTCMGNDAVYLMDSNEFAESVTYQPRAGGTRVIRAVVVRDVPRAVPEQSFESISRHIEIVVANNATSGISASELDLGGDTVLVTDRLGKSSESHQIIQLQSQDEAVLQLELR